MWCMLLFLFSCIFSEIVDSVLVQHTSMNPEQQADGTVPNKQDKQIVPAPASFLPACFRSDQVPIQPASRAVFPAMNAGYGTADKYIAQPASYSKQQTSFTHPPSSTHPSRRHTPTYSREEDGLQRMNKYLNQNAAGAQMRTNPSTLYPSRILENTTPYA